MISSSWSSTCQIFVKFLKIFLQILTNLESYFYFATSNKKSLIDKTILSRLFSEGTELLSFGEPVIDKNLHCGKVLLLI